MAAKGPRKSAAAKKPGSRQATAAGKGDATGNGAGAANQAAAAAAGGERIAKRMARAGLCSRREAERWIDEGRVRLNGRVLTSPAVTVGARDVVEVDGKRLGRPEPVKLWRYHKPKGLVTSHDDPQGRRTVFASLPEDFPRVISVGRLDLNTEGLLLLTNDGGLARYMELPSTGWARRYRVRVHGKIDEAALADLQNGIVIEGVRYGSVTAEIDGKSGANTWLTVSVREGKNREVRRILEHLDLQVTRLIRLSYGPFQLGDLARGAVAAVPERVLRDQLGDKAADFAWPEPRGRKRTLRRAGAKGGRDAHRRR